MTISTRVAPGILTAVLLFSPALAPAAFARDPMAQDVDFRNSLSRDGGVRKETVFSDSTKKDDGMRKSGMSK